jgi:hypothetical protein
MSGDASGCRWCLAAGPMRRSSSGLNRDCARRARRSPRASQVFRVQDRGPRGPWQANGADRPDSMRRRRAKRAGGPDPVRRDDRPRVIRQQRASRAVVPSPISRLCLTESGPSWPWSQLSRPSGVRSQLMWLILPACAGSLARSQLPAGLPGRGPGDLAVRVPGSPGALRAMANGAGTGAGLLARSCRDAAG